jgi:AcrR family transcriptional regulator
MNAIPELHASDPSSLILTCAIDLLLDKGYEGTTLEEIGTRSGYDLSMVHGLWKTREELFTSLIDLVMPRLIDRLQNIMDSSRDYVMKLETLLDEYIRFYGSNNTVLKVLHAGGLHTPEGEHDNFRDILKRYKSIIMTQFNNFFQQGIERGFFTRDVNAALLSQFLLTSLDGYLYMTILDHEYDNKYPLATSMPVIINKYVLGNILSSAEKVTG